MTITGETVAETLADVPDEPRADQDVIRPWARRCTPQGHLAILRGNLAPEGSVAKITGVKNAADHRTGARLRLRGGVPRRRSSRGRSAPAT